MTTTARASAHRGDNRHAPESTIPAIRMAWEKGAHQIEFDVQMTCDGQLVCLHDGTVDRTTDGTGLVSCLTLEQIQSLDAGSWKSPEYAGATIPTFREVLQAAPPPVLLNVHLRRIPGLVQMVIDEIIAQDRVEQCVLAASEDQLHESRAICPELRICNMEGQIGPASEYADKTIALGAEFIQVWGWNEALPGICDRLHDAGVTINFFGSEDPAQMRSLVECGIDYILTDDLDTLVDVLREYGVAPLATVPVAP